VFFDTRWVNHSTDHRLEVIFDTGEKVERTQSENHFSVLTRMHDAKAKVVLPVERASEAPLDRFPCQRFFIANDQLFLNKGLPEYAVNGNEVSLTALRAVSRLSRPRLQTRGSGAGPAVGTPEANCLGMNVVSYGWAALSEFCEYDQIAEAYSLAEGFEGTVYAVPIKAKALPTSAVMFSIDNTDVRCISMYRNGEKTFIRLLNVAPEAGSCELTVSLPHKKLQRCNLDEVLQEEVSGAPGKSGGTTYRIEFGENQLLTLCLS
jgi:alpha-mannosidase